MSPNTLAWAALYGWPLVVLAVYAMRRESARLARTTAWMLILPVMFLPSLVNLPFAALDKSRIAVLSIAVALALFHRHELLARARWRRFPLFVLFVIGLGAFQTVRTNHDPLNYGLLTLPGLGARDGIWMLYGFFVDAYLPFVVGQRVFKTERDLRDLLTVLSKCALIYAPLCVIEMRLSPQFSNWVYGYFPHAFEQTMRGSGYRPVVFMNHGLSVAMFLFSGFCASIALHKACVTGRPPPKQSAVIVGALLLAGRSLASIIYSLVTLFLLVWPSSKATARVVLVIAIVVIGYPALRAYGIIPLHEISEFFAGISSERSSSLTFRFDQEEALLAHAMERPFFGWGAWSRNRIFVTWGDPVESVRDVSVTDGAWIIVLGVSGLIGFLGTFALMILPLLRYMYYRARMSRPSQALLAALALIVAFFTLDLLPNANSDFLQLAYSGALFTLSHRLSRRRAARMPACNGPTPSSIADKRAPTLGDPLENT
jgi:hypothetical protein